MRIDDLQLRRLGDDSEVRSHPLFRKPLHAEKRVLLVDCASHNYAGGISRSFADQARERGQHRRHTALHVA